jgi:LysM repeat protein
MSSPNPLIPQGSLLEQQAKSKSTFHVAALIVGLHVAVLGGLLIIGCKREEPKPADSLSGFDALPPTNTTIITETNTLDPAMLAGGASYLSPVPPADGLPPVTFESPTNPGPFTPLQPSQPLANESLAGATSEYVVKKGDIAGRIASRNKISLKQLQEANAGVDLNRLKIGQKLNLPAGAAAPTAPIAGGGGESAGTVGAESVTYVVKGGDTLTRIARIHGTTVEAIRTASGLKSNDIRVGQKLKVPSKAAAPAPVPAPAAANDPTANPVLPTATPITNPTAGPLPR